MRILVVEDERKIAGFLERGLREEGHVVTVAGDLRQARGALAGERFDLLVVDRMLPDGDGLAVVRERRRQGDPTPILCLTARERVDERVEGLEAGADDYLVKPFAFDELLARVRALARRGTARTDTIVVGDLVIDLPARRVRRGEDEVRLTAREFDLLRYLAEHAGHVLDRSRLFAAVWDGDADGDTSVVEVYVSYLRAKLDKGRDRPLLHTVRGVGYVLEDRAR